MGDMADEIAVASPSRPDGDWAPRAGETTRGAPFSKENELKLPVYIEVEDSACVAAWLACNGQHLPLKRVVDELASRSYSRGIVFEAGERGVKV
jgi:hypothetical protein